MLTNKNKGKCNGMVRLLSQVWEQMLLECFCRCIQQQIGQWSVGYIPSEFGTMATTTREREKNRLRIGVRTCSGLSRQLRCGFLFFSCSSRCSRDICRYYVGILYSLFFCAFILFGGHIFESLLVRLTDHLNSENILSHRNYNPQPKRPA